MFPREGLLKLVFCALKIKNERRSKGSSPGLGGLLWAAHLPRDPLQRVWELSRDGRQSGGLLEIIPRVGMCGCFPKMAGDPLMANLNLPGESGGRVLERVLDPHI